jgi:hypothetical protein
MKTTFYGLYKQTRDDCHLDWDECEEEALDLYERRSEADTVAKSLCPKAINRWSLERWVVKKEVL